MHTLRYLLPAGPAPLLLLLPLLSCAAQGAAEEVKEAFQKNPLGVVVALLAILVISYISTMVISAEFEKERAKATKELTEAKREAEKAGSKATQDLAAATKEMAELKKAKRNAEKAGSKATQDLAAASKELADFKDPILKAKCEAEAKEAKVRSQQQQKQQQEQQSQQQNRFAAAEVERKRVCQGYDGPSCTIDDIGVIDGSKYAERYTDGRYYNNDTHTSEDRTKPPIVGRLVIPSAVTVIGKHAFQGCQGLTQVVIGPSVTVISDYAFFNCPALSSVTIPDSVVTIGEKAFAGKTPLRSVSMPGTAVAQAGRYIQTGTFPVYADSYDEGSFPAGCTVYGRLPGGGGEKVIQKAR